MRAGRTGALARLAAIAAASAGFAVSAAPDARSATLDDLWQGRAHFVEVGRLDWTVSPHGDATESSGWVSVSEGVWYLFNRRTTEHATAGCAYDHTAVVVRTSRDQGATWSDPVTAVEPGASVADGCAILDGTSVRDPATGTWDMLAQCLGAETGWQLCHYTRASPDPLGPFEPDPRNPVVRSGALWSQICAASRACDPSGVRDEGTPDIVMRRSGEYYVTFHGYDYGARLSYRGVARTSDFRTWTAVGGDLPGAPILSAAECEGWMPGCVGVGLASSHLSGDWHYLLMESATKALTCTPGQDWVFALLRTPAGLWPPAEGARWESFPGNPLLRPSRPGPAARCSLQYAHWIADGPDLFVLYEDWGEDMRDVRRRLMKLEPGPGPAVEPLRLDR